MILQTSLYPSSRALFLLPIVLAFFVAPFCNGQQLRGINGADKSTSYNGTALQLAAEGPINGTAAVKVVGHRELGTCDGYFCDLYLDQICVIMTHNSHAVPGDSWSPNQFKREPSQFIDGVRAFAMDLYEDTSGKLILKHGSSDPLEVDYEQRVRDIVDVMDRPQYRNEFLLVQFESYLSSEQGIRKACKAWGDKIITNFDSNNVKLGHYISQGKRVLLLTDRGRAMPHLGLHHSTKFLAENKYKWTNSLVPPDMAQRRGPQAGSHRRYARMMNYFCSRTGIGNPLTSADVNNPSRMLYHARQYMKQSYAGGKVNVIMVDFYTEGNPLGAQRAIRDGNLYSGCLKDGKTCFSGSSCFQCCAESHEWWESKAASACGKEPCWKSGSYSDAIVTKRKCCRGAYCPWYWFGVCKCN